MRSERERGVPLTGRTRAPVTVIKASSRSSSQSHQATDACLRIRRPSHKATRCVFCACSFNGTHGPRSRFLPSAQPFWAVVIVIDPALAAR